MIIRFRDLYTKAPGPIKRLVGFVPFQYRFGAAYRRTLAFLRESDNWTAAQFRVWQAGRLEELLRRAIRHVPYYQKYTALLGKPAFDILRDIEPVGKSALQNDPEAFALPIAMRGAHHETFTGGSSGYPLRILQDDDAVEIEWAFMVHQWARAGYRPGDRRVTFRGVEFRDGSQGDIVENPVYNETLFSPFHLTDTVLEEYVTALKRIRPRFLRGYPSAMTILARYVRDNEVTDLPSLAGLLCGSEGISADQRDFLERTFKARVYSWYGMTEKVVLAGECESSTLYHAFPQYGVTEVADKGGNVTQAVGAKGEIVGTGFLNRVMPFIRYRLDDWTTIQADQCSSCGRNHPLLGSISGHRAQDVIIGRSGAQISMTALNMHDDTFRRVRQFQFHQRERGKVTLLVRAREGFDDESRRLIITSLRRKTGEELDYDIRLVDKIDQTGMGKGVYLKQELMEAGELSHLRHS